jgi:hypothetical protein
MEKSKQQIKNETLHKASVSKNRLCLITTLFVLLSFLETLGIGFTYTDNLMIHDLGNYLGISNFVFVLPSILLIIFWLIKRVPRSIILVPFLYVLHPFSFFLLIFISSYFFSTPLFNSDFANTFLSPIYNNNYFVMTYYMCIFFYSVYLIKVKIKNM